MVEKNGVFLHSKNLESEFMVKCLQMLVNNFPEIKISSVEADKSYFGFRVHFSSPNEEVVLAKKQLVVSGRNVRMAPLRTSLTIHGAPKEGTDQFDSELRKALQKKFGKVIGTFHAVTNPENVTTDNLRATVDVPELEELKVFNHEGYPDMVVCFPLSNHMHRVTFYCRRCKNGGHVQQNCPFPTLKIEPRSSEVFKPACSRPLSSSEIEDEEEEMCEDFNSNESDRSGPSWRNLASQSKSTTAVEKTSPQLQGYINLACKEFDIIARRQLYDFFREVKNKRNPSKIAKDYTNKPQTLKTLLKKIINLFSAMSDVATNEDRLFISWLKKLVNRYEGNARSKSRGKGKSSGQFYPDGGKEAFFKKFGIL